MSDVNSLLNSAAGNEDTVNGMVEATDPVQSFSHWAPEAAAATPTARGELEEIDNAGTPLGTVAIARVINEPGGEALEVETSNGTIFTS